MSFQIFNPGTSFTELKRGKTGRPAGCCRRLDMSYGVRSLSTVPGTSTSYISTAMLPT